MRATPGDSLRGMAQRIGRRMTTPTGVILAHLLPMALAAAAASAWLGMFSEWGRAPILVADLVVATGTLALGILGGALAGRAALERQRRREVERWERRLMAVAHDLRAPLTVIRGEVELVLGGEALANERRRSADVVLSEVDRATEVVSRATGPPPESSAQAGVPRALPADREPRLRPVRLARTDETMAADHPADRADVIRLRGRGSRAGRRTAGGPASGDPGVA